MNSPDIDAEFDPFENDPGKKKSSSSSGGSGGGIAWLALLLGLVAISYSAWQWWSDQAPDPQDQDRQQATERLAQTQSGIRETLESLQSRLALAEQNDDMPAIQSDIGAMQSRLSELVLGAADDHTVIEALQVLMTDINQRLADVETGIAALAVRSDTPGKTMDLAEVDYLLRLASERLALFGDARSAGRALGLADTQLEAMEDPLYIPVRRRISESRQALQDLPQPDVVAISAQIEGLQAAIPGLPFPGEAPVPEAAQAPDPDAGWWQRFKNALKPLVKVRRRVNEDLELTLEDKDYLRQGLWLQLESARLAVMRNDAIVWSHSLQRARQGLENRFDPASKPVANAIGSIGQLQVMELAGELPDISAAWRQLRLLREGRPDSGPAAQEVPVESGTGEAEEEAEADAEAPPAENEGDSGG